MSLNRMYEISLPYEEIEGRRRNSRTFVANGFGYHVNKSHHKGTVLYLGCVTDKSCPATAILYESKKILKPRRDHNHPPTPQEFVKIKFMASLKRKVEHSDLKLSDLFRTELEKANVKNPHDMGIDFRKLEPTLYQRRIKTNKKQLLSPMEQSSSCQMDDSALERTGVVPPFNSEEDADNLNRETSLGVHSMEIGAEGSIGDDSCSRDEHDSSQQEIYSTIDASDINSHSPHQLPFSVPAMKASPGPKQSLQTKLASSSHVSEELPTTSSLDMQQPTTSLSYMPPPTTSSSYIQPPTTSSSNMPPPTTSSSFIQPPTTSSSYMPPPTTSSSDSTGSESYQLRHNNHLSLVLNQLAEDEAFMDVMLTAEGRQVKAHKSVLSAVSPYFSGVLRSNPCQHPVIIMPNDVRYDDLARIISFIYRGEVCVPAKELMSLMKVADQLLITGLSQKGNRDILSYLNGSSTEGSPSPPSVPHSLARGTPGTHSEADAVCSSQRQESTEQSNTKKRAKAADRIGSHSSGSQATPSSTETREPPSLQSGQDSDDDSDGFTSDFLDPTPVGSPSNDTPVVDVDISLIKEETFTDLFVEDPLNDLHSSSDDLLDSIRESCSKDDNPCHSSPGLGNVRKKITRDKKIKSEEFPPSAPRNTRRSTATDLSTSSSSSCNMNPMVRLEQVGPSSTATDISKGYTSLPSMEHDPYVCPYCCQAFSDLTDHFSNHHIMLPAFICSRCSRVFTDKAVFISHRAKCN